jgi:hypothetical protein
MMMDNCMDSGENGNEHVDRKVREYLYAIDLCKKCAKCGRRTKDHMSESLLSQDANVCVKVGSGSAAANRFVVELVLAVPLNTAAN